MPEARPSSRCLSFYSALHYEWVAIVVVGLLLPAAMNAWIPPHVRPVDLRDPAVQYPYKRPTVTAAAALLVAWLVPPLSWLVMASLRDWMAQGDTASGGGWERSGSVAPGAEDSTLPQDRQAWREFCAGLAEANGLTALLTIWVKCAAGRPRPHFAAVCKAYQDEVLRMGCTGDPMLVHEARKAFPSGHASISAAAATYLTCWIDHVCPQWFPHSPRQMRWIRRLGALLPMTYAVAMAMTRVRDYHHDYVDVLAGLVLGAYVGHLVYRVRYGPHLRMNAAACGVSEEAMSALDKHRHTPPPPGAEV
ncbi:hypothetical protein CDCA_CDCA01G0453 [Cyanidium caldarium]|uniref:Phosphatidic acid phosphatase type 2/haloperoxidase domain-containing protein n=1 Tax=Cyanidium caldarium TaxID=2771 RepID=A0AAV9IQY0_CYACA|nr:hypothetical protein CDCA_CDCA01G0453 [Cyanidium caldarium]